MATRLNLVLDGDAPGLPEHALSISAFGMAFVRLVSALQRIGSGLVKDAVGEEYGARGGRHSPAGRSIDVEIVSLQGNSPLNIELRVIERIAPGANLPLFDDLTKRTTDRFLEAVEQESKGQPSNRLVRRYLAAMPIGITSQQYISDGKRVTIGELDLPEIPRPLPFLVEFSGAIVGLGFEPGKPEVRFKINEGTVAFSATAEQVEEAVSYRGATVRAFAVKGPKSRLLLLGPIDMAFPVPAKDARAEYLFTKWDSLLKRLAE